MVLTLFCIYSEVCEVVSFFPFPFSLFISLFVSLFNFFFYVDITSSLPGAHGYQLIWPLTFDLDPKGHMKKRRQNRNLHLETRKTNKVRIFSHPCLAPMDTNLFDPWPLTLTPLPGAHGYQLIWPLTFDLDPKGHMKKRRQNRNLHLETRKINKVRIFSHPCLAPMDTNLFDPWPLTLIPKVIWKNGAKIETYTWRPGKSIKFEFFLISAWRPSIPTYLTPDLWPWPQRSYEKTAPKSKLTPGDQENQ